ncbi:MAG: hypothetical protein JNM40_25200 [Myxococcales bacterium]|nr:hypothetical protein [Myxococcales bacterium]
MNRQIEQMFAAAEGRYLSPSEQSSLREFAQGIDARLIAMTEISSKEAVIIERTVREIFRAYPDLEKKYKNAKQTCMRDETMVLRYAALAMLKNDPQYLNDSLLTWMATILKGVGFAPHFIEDTYKTLAAEAAKELNPATMKLLQPFLTQCAQVLSGKGADAAAQEAK